MLTNLSSGTRCQRFTIELDTVETQNAPWSTTAVQTLGLISIHQTLAEMMVISRGVL